MKDDHRVVLEGLTVNHYQMYTRLSVGLPLLPAVQMLERFQMLELLPDAGTVAVKISGRPAGGQIFLPVVKFFDLESNFFTTQQNATKRPKMTI